MHRPHLKIPHLAACAAALALVPAASAAASQELGATAPPSAPVTCIFGSAVTAAGFSASYTVPSAGVITAFRTANLGTFGDAYNFRVFRNDGANIKGIARIPATLTASGGALVDARVPVKQGDHIGFSKPAKGAMSCVLAGTAEDVTRVFPGDIDDGLSFPASPVKNERPNLAATFEPDADGDGFGDDSQDACPNDPRHELPCTPPPPKDEDETGPAHEQEQPAPAADQPAAPAPATAPAPAPASDASTPPTVAPSSTPIAAATCKLRPRKLRGLTVKRAKRRLKRAACTKIRVRKARNAHGKLTVKRAKLVRGKVRLTVV